MTSNIRIEEISRIGFDTGNRTNAEIQLNSLKGFFRTELINRIDEVIIFNTLDRDSIRQILIPLLEEIRSNLRRINGVELTVNDTVIKYIALQGHSTDFGARELRRTVDNIFQGGLGE